MIIGANPLHPGNYRACQFIVHTNKEYATYIPPRLRHEARYDPMLYADALGRKLEELCIVGHTQGRSVRKGSLVYARTSLSVVCL